jgi:GNAT superfamily N-acetyltransferase
VSVLIRRSAPDDAADLRALVHPVPGAQLSALTPEYVASHPVFGAWEGVRLAGFFALEERGGHWWLAHLWVAEEQRGRGRGRWLLTDAIRRARRLGADSLRFTPEPEARAFFQRLGARTSPEARAELEIDVTSWMEPLPESVSELGSTE